MTFRLLFTPDGIHNYFWKARLLPKPRETGGLTMGSHGIKDQVAIVGMGCTRFGEHWDKGTDDLLIESSNEAFESRGHHARGRRRLLARHRHVGHVGHGRWPAR